MINYNWEREKNKYPYGFNGGIFQKEHNGVTYLIKHAMECITEQYDEEIDGVFKKSFIDLGYGWITDYNISNKEVDTMDFTWMNESDMIILDAHSDYDQIKNIKINIANLKNSHVPRHEKEKQVSLTICNNDTKISSAKQILRYKSFIKKYNNIFNSVKFEGFTPAVENILSLYSQKYNVEVLDKEKGKVKIKK